MKISTAENHTESLNHEVEIMNHDKFKFNLPYPCVS